MSRTVEVSQSESVDVSGEEAMDIVRIATPPAPRARVIFVHGLDGDARMTWRNTSTGFFWPQWLGEQLPDVEVLSIQYPAGARSYWLSTAPGLSVSHRATALLDYLAVSGCLDLPLVFVVHSMGGLIAKRMLELADDLLLSARDEEEKRKVLLAKNTRGVLFLATPHLGSSVARWVRLFGRFFASDAITSLVAGSSELVHIHARFVGRTRMFGAPAVKVYYEMHPTFFAWVVTAASAEFPGVENIPVDANHIDIAKPRTERSPVCKGGKQFVLDNLTADGVALPDAKAKLAEGVSLASLRPLAARRPPRLAIASALGAIVLIAAGAAYVAHEISETPAPPPPTAADEVPTAPAPVTPGAVEERPPAQESPEPSGALEMETVREPPRSVSSTSADPTLVAGSDARSRAASAPSGTRRVEIVRCQQVPSGWSLSTIRTWVQTASARTPCPESHSTVQVRGCIDDVIPSITYACCDRLSRDCTEPMSAQLPREASP